MARIDELLNKILSQDRDLLTPVVLVSQFAEELVQQYPGGGSSWKRYLRERSVEDAISLYTALFAIASHKEEEVGWVARILANDLFEASSPLAEAIESDLSDELAAALISDLSDIKSETEFVRLVKNRPELLGLDFDARLAAQSLGALWAHNQPQQAVVVTQVRQALLKYRRQRQSGQEISDVASNRGRGSQFTHVAQSSMNQGTILAKHVMFFEDPAEPHPLLKGGEQFNVIALPDLLYLQDDRTGQELLSIPWGNIRLNGCRRATRKKSTARRALADLVRIFTPFGEEYEHEGLQVPYWDTVYNGELKVFFRTFGGDDEIDKLKGTIVRYAYDYQRRAGQVGRPH